MTLICGFSAYSQNTIPTTTCTGAMKINDSLNVNKDIMALGDITSKGEMVATNTMRAMENVIASKDIKVEGSVYIGDKLNVAGQSIFEKEIILKNGIIFDGVSGLFRTPPTATTGEIFQLGNSGGKTLPYYACQARDNEPTNAFYYNGNFVSYLPLGSNTNAPLVDASLRIGIAPWNGNAVIDVSGVDNFGAGNNGLDINYFCKRNTSINTGWDLDPNNSVNGGRVFMGAEVEMMRSLKIGRNGLTTIDPNTSIEINQNDNNSNGVKVNTFNNSVKAFSVFNTGNSFNKNTFIVYGDGRTQIGAETPVGHNALLSVSGEIDCKSLFVLKPTTWQDKVFTPDYKLQNLKEVESYIMVNKHLPGVKSEKEILENGYDVNETDAVLLEKIENLYLYIIQQQKEIDALKRKINNH